jgi:hypothetical protein
VRGLNMAACVRANLFQSRQELGVGVGGKGGALAVVMVRM